MPCLSPITIRNPKYISNDKNHGCPPPCPRPEMRYLRVDCGKCFQCMRKRAMQWRFRLHQEYKYSDHKRFHFVTLTFSDDALFNLRSEFPGKDDNYICKVALRRFLERYRKKYGVSLRHFMVTELGGQNDRIHMHGMIVDCKCGFWKRNKYFADIPLLTDLWSYGFVFIGWCNDRSISYITKYLMKVDSKHLDFRPKLFVSPGFGKMYVVRNSQYHRDHDIWYCYTSSGYKISMPRYYKLKIWSDLERLLHWSYMIDNPPPYVLNGITYDTETDYLLAVKSLCERTRSLGLPVPDRFDPTDKNFQSEIFLSSDF